MQFECGREVMVGFGPGSVAFEPDPAPIGIIRQADEAMYLTPAEARRLAHLLELNAKLAELASSKD